MLALMRQDWEEHARAMLERGAMTATEIDRLEVDLNCCLALERFDYGMEVHWRDGLVVMEAAAGAG